MGDLTGVHYVTWESIITILELAMFSYTVVQQINQELEQANTVSQELKTTPNG
jgi:hypothetical protein